MIAEISENGILQGAQNLYSNHGDTCGAFAKSYR